MTYTLYSSIRHYRKPETDHGIGILAVTLIALQFDWIPDVKPCLHELARTGAPSNRLSASPHVAVSNASAEIARPAMSLAPRAARAARGALRTRRGLSSPAAPTKGPRLPEGNDPSAFHGRDHAAKDTSRWLMFSALFALPVGGFGVLQAMKPHEHPPAPIQYDYMKRATRIPRFPWGVSCVALPLLHARLVVSGLLREAMAFLLGLGSSGLQGLCRLLMFVFFQSIFFLLEQDDDLIGVPYEKHAEHADGEH